MKAPTLTTERLELRDPLDRPGGGDLDDEGLAALEARLVAILSDPDQSRFMQCVPYPYGSEAARGFIAFLGKVRSDPSHIEWGIFDRERPGLIMGMVALEEIGLGEGPTGLCPGDAEIGYWLAKESWGRGLASEAAAAVAGFGFRRLGLQRLEARVTKGNTRSLALLERLGFSREGLRRRAAYFKGEHVDRWVLGLLREEWEAARGGCFALGDPEIWIRRAGSLDDWLGPRRALWSDCPDDEHASEISAWKADPDVLPAWLAIEGGKIEGFLEASVRSSAPEGFPAGTASRSMYMEGCFVPERLRLRGIGAALFGAAETWARERGIPAALSDTEPGNGVSRAFHARLGYTEVGRSDEGLLFSKEL